MDATNTALPLMTILKEQLAQGRGRGRSLDSYWSTPGHSFEVDAEQELEDQAELRTPE